jgi:hypothetical protein
MSQENVEFVRRYLSEFNATHRLPEDMVSPAFVWDMSTFEGWPGRSRFTGVSEFEAFLAGWTAPYTEWVNEVEQLRDAGQDRVIGVLVQRGRLRGGSSWVEMHYAIVYTLKDAVIGRAQVYSHPEDALEAVGLRE